MPTFKRDLYLGRDVALIKGDDIDNGAVTTEKLADKAVTADKLADGTYDSIAEHFPIATKDSLGLVKIGDGLEVKTDGTVSTEVKTIPVTELDSLCPDISSAAEIVKDKRHSRYIVLGGNGNAFKVGTLDVFSDSLHHVVTQVLTSHYVYESGVLDTTTHKDAELTKYYRSYKIDGTLPVSTGEWTEWKVLDNGLTALIEAEAAERKALASSVAKDYIAQTEKDAAAGVPSLDDDAKIYESSLPSLAVAQALPFYDVSKTEFTGTLSDVGIEGGNIVFYSGQGFIANKGGVYSTTFPNCEFYGHKIKGSGIQPTQGKMFFRTNDSETHLYVCGQSGNLTRLLDEQDLGDIKELINNL